MGTRTIQLRIKLHQAQKAFRRSDAPLRALVGGIGSGKSWAGSLDMLLRAKPGRLYAVVSPSYGMLSDSTFRSFEGLARQLCLADSDDIKKSAPPAIRLRTGAEVLFRSADDPERLRGPNLSGVWMDEASLMSEDAFTILLGRLREGGEVGWLSATFTPKGKSHWTYETFATGRPDTAIFHARTADNPFLPARFHETVRRQYTSALAAQELEGEFLSSGGTLFQRRWFQVVDTLPAIKRRVRAWDLAATPKDEEKLNDPDWTAGVLFGTDELGTYFVEDVRRIRGTPKQVKEFVKATAAEDGPAVTIWLEQEPGSSGAIVVDDFYQLLAGYDFHAERSTGVKAERAKPLAAQAEGRAVKLLRGPWNRDFLNEAESFPFGRHDDQVDAASLAFNKLAFPAAGVFRREDIEAAVSSTPELDDLTDKFTTILRGEVTR
jgi:predicted phage terminase large subunit-like protein